MVQLGLERSVVDKGVYANSVGRFRQAGILLPTFSQLADPARIPERILAGLASVDPQGPHSLNLFRVHWHNDRKGRRVPVPEFIELPSSLTGVEARIVVLLGNRFPMIRAHKVLAAYGCLAPRVVTGQFDPTAHRAVWPSTGNYCRGGVAISRIMGCRGVAVLPEGMSRERFRWLEEWVADPEDIIKTPGSESNVKEIYDACARLSEDDANVVFNQFSEFGNYLVHYLCTGKALDLVFEAAAGTDAGARPRAFVCATGSAGTLGAGDYLKARRGSLIVAVEALECPTMLINGFGQHNIQGIGDKHIPLIHNVMNTDVVVAVSDRSTDALNVLFNTGGGKAYLSGRRGVDGRVVEGLSGLGLSGICNVLAAVKTARHYGMDRRDVLLTVATDDAALYGTERDRVLARDYPGGFDAVSAAEVFGRDLLGAGTDHMMELTRTDRRRIFNLGYFTWVEQQGVALDDFAARGDERFWRDLEELIPAWDSMIEEFNRETGLQERSA
jgi:cysteine synthase